MSSYTEFEALLLVGCYIVSEDTGDEIIGIRPVIERFNLEYKSNWIRRAITGFVDAGLAKDVATLGDELEQDVWLTASGVKEAERLLDNEQVRIRMPETPETSIPASDRIVKRSDNSAGFASAENSLEQLIAQLDTANDLGSLTAEEIEEARREVWILEQSIKQEAVRVDWIEPIAKACLKWIATKAAEQVVGTLAMAALAAIALLLGFSV